MYQKGPVKLSECVPHSSKPFDPPSYISMLKNCPLVITVHTTNVQTRSDEAMKFKTFGPCHKKRPRDIQKSGQCFYVTMMILILVMTCKVFMNVMVPFLRLWWRHHDILHSQVVCAARCCDVVVQLCTVMELSDWQPEHKNCMTATIIQKVRKMVAWPPWYSPSLVVAWKGYILYAPEALLGIVRCGEWRDLSIQRFNAKTGIAVIAILLRASNNGR